MSTTNRLLNKVVGQSPRAQREIISISPVVIATGLSVDPGHCEATRIPALDVGILARRAFKGSQMFGTPGQPSMW